MKRISVFLITTILSGCSLAPDYSAPDMPTPGWREAKDTNQVTLPIDAELRKDLWKSFGNDELDALVTEALNSNTDLNAAIARVSQARASADITASSLFPTLDAVGDVGRDFTNPGNGRNTSVNSYRAGAQVGYELDLFGRNRSNAQAAWAAADATAFDRDAIALITASDTAQSFISLLALDDRLLVAGNNLENAQEVLRITQARFDVGTLSALELAQQKTDLANTEASIALLIQQREALLNQLAVLVGKAPQDFTVTSKGLGGFVLPEIAPLQPAELLTRRPDIRAAEASLQAANYDIGAARAAFFPNFSLSATAAIGANPASAAASLTSALAAAISQPIFSGGALTGGLELSQARRDELESQYKKVVLTSFQEVQDALAAQIRSAEQVRQFTLASEEAQTAYSLVRQRFDAGIIDFLTLLDAQRSLFNAQDALITARGQQLASVIDLYKALGGGWKE